MPYHVDTTKKVQCGTCAFIWFPSRNGLVRPHKNKGSTPIVECSGVGKLGRAPEETHAQRAEMHTAALREEITAKSDLVSSAVEARRAEQRVVDAKTPAVPAPAPKTRTKGDELLAKQLKALFAPLLRRRAKIIARIDSLENRISVLHQTAERYRAALAKINEVAGE
jgi:hypothetical protein